MDVGLAAHDVAPRRPVMKVRYDAPQAGFPNHRCATCGARPSVARVWWGSYGGGHARYFCGDHVWDANRVFRELRAGGERAA